MLVEILILLIKIFYFILFVKNARTLDDKFSCFNLFSSTKTKRTVTFQDSGGGAFYPKPPETIILCNLSQILMYKVVVYLSVDYFW